MLSLESRVACLPLLLVCRLCPEGVGANSEGRDEEEFPTLAEKKKKFLPADFCMQLL